MSDVADDSKELERWYQELKRVVSGNGGPPPAGRAVSSDNGDNGPMEARVIKLEEFAQDTRERLTRIETRLEQTSTKADLSEAMNGMVKWVVGTAVGLGVAGITIMTFVLNNATPKSPVGATPTPIIINVPAQTAPQPAPSPPTSK